MVRRDTDGFTYRRDPPGPGPGGLGMCERGFGILVQQVTRGDEVACDVVGGGLVERGELSRISGASCLASMSEGIDGPAGRPWSASLCGRGWEMRARLGPDVRGASRRSRGLRRAPPALGVRLGAAVTAAALPVLRSHRSPSCQHCPAKDTVEFAGPR